MMNWDLTYFYKNQEEFDKDYNKVKEMVNKLASFKGKLGEESEFKNYLLLSKETDLVFGKVFIIFLHKWYGELL